ncbi:MAG: hypothetical protein ABIR91_00855, partial [Candidatus Saccharimonadales bacterium]
MMKAHYSRGGLSDVTYGAFVEPKFRGRHDMLTIKRPVFRFKKSVGVTKKRRMQQVTLFAFAGIIAFTMVNPAYAVELFRINNPRVASRQNVAPLSSAPNSPIALPQKLDVNKQSISPNMNDTKAERKAVRELTDERTAYNKVFLNSDGTKTLEYATTQQHYKDAATDKQWKEIDNTLTQKYAADSSRYFEGDAGKMSSTLKRLADGVTVNVEQKKLDIKPLGANNIVPEQLDDHTVVYREAWPGVDLQYELRGEAVKEIIVVKNKNAVSTYNFSVDGGKVINHPTRENELAIAGLSDDYSFSALTLDVNGRGVINEERVTQKPAADGASIIVAMDKNWLKQQPTSAFPMRIDPTLTRQSEIQYKMYRSDNFYCNASNCYANTGSLDDGGWKHWRSYVRFDYSALNNKTVLNADLYGWFKSGIGGSTASKTITMGLSNCNNAFNCAGTAVGSAVTTTNFNIDFTSKLKSLVDTDSYGAWWSIKGQEGSSLTYKPYYDMKATITYDTPTPAAVASAPADKSSVVTTTPTLKVNNVTDADGDAVKYYHRVSTNPDGETGAVINSGWVSSSQWTVPENILQDGRTYYW